MSADMENTFVSCISFPTARDSVYSLVYIIYSPNLHAACRADKLRPVKFKHIITQRYTVKNSDHEM